MVIHNTYHPSPYPLLSLLSLSIGTIQGSKPNFTVMHPSSNLNPCPTVLPPLKPALTGSQISSPTSESTLPLRFAVSRARPYTPHLTPLSSLFQQHIPAKECLFVWTPASSSRVPLAGLIPADIDHIREVLTFAWADGTLKTYGSGLLVYHVFCDNKHVAEHNCCPAPALLISAFVYRLRLRDLCLAHYPRSLLDNEERRAGCLAMCR